MVVAFRAVYAVAAEGTGAAVRSELDYLSQKTGVIPCEIVSDCGADLEKGISLFCPGRPTRRVKDIAHAAANAVKRELNGNAQWDAFLRETSHAKAKMRQTKFAFLLPPESKAKARWMNLDALVTWSRKAIDFVDMPRPVPGASWEGTNWKKRWAGFGVTKNHLQRGPRCWKRSRPY